ncbi:MAG TPA: hypothetical protein VNI01_01835 [Elusimicrobiota bacterium]|jgi:hypothetical protein|nr:hypothetical protein [Elusimicrobiota bacterium]
MRADAAALAVLALVSLAPRLLGLPYRYHNIDEFISLRIAVQPTLAAALAALRGLGPLQMPLDYVAEFLAARWTFDLDRLRLLPLAWGEAAIAATYFLGRRVGGRRFGLLWACLLSISLVHIEFSQTFRPYSLAAFLGLLVSLAFLDLLDGASAWGYGAAMLGFQASYLPALFVGLSHLAWAAWRRRAKVRASVAALAPSWAAFAAWLLAGGSRLAKEQVFFGVSQDGFGPAAIRRVFADLSQRVPAAQAVYGAAFVLGAALWWRRRRDEVSLGLSALLLPLACVLFSHYWLSYGIYSRHVLPLLPLYLAFVAAAMAAAAEAVAARLPRWPDSARVVSVALMLFVLCDFFATGLNAYAFEDAVADATLRDGLATLSGRLGPDDAVVFGNPNTATWFLYGMEPGVIARLGGGLHHGFYFFELPRDLRVSYEGKSVPAYTLCERYPPRATIGRAEFQALRARVAAAGGTVWLVYLASYNYTKEANPFYAGLGLTRKELVGEGSGVFSLRKTSGGVR